MATRAALATITNIKADKAYHGKIAGKKQINNINNVVEQVEKQWGHIEIFKDEDEAMDIEIPSHITSLPSPIVNFSIVSRDDCLKEYLKDTELYFYQKESEYIIRENYLEGSPLTSKMRALLVDWLVEVQVQFDLLQETLFLAVNILDRFLQEEGQKTHKNQLQLVGVTAMFIACKVEEVFMPDPSYFVLITESTYNMQDIKNMEIKILATLKFKLSRPLPLSFLFLSYEEGDSPLPQYILELSLLDYAQVSLPPSLAAAAALHLSRLLQGYPRLEKTSTYSAQQLLPVIKRMAAVLLGAEDNCLQAVMNKYSTLQFGRVAQLEEISEHVLWELTHMQ
jgi:hypothetical protein